MAVIAVAGLSVRALAEAATREGHGVIGLDLFGDADTRRACVEWHAIGRPGSLSIDADRLLTALHACAARGDVVGWIPGAGFEGLPGLIEQGARLLPQIGMAAEAIRRVRDPRSFFGALQQHGMAHPELRWSLPVGTDVGADGEAKAARWLLKDTDGSGGWHIRLAGRGHDATLPPRHYLQREIRGTSMSATYLADGQAALRLGCNELIVRPFGTSPFVYCGVVGPVPVAEAVGTQIDAALRMLTQRFDLRGLGSLDFLLADGVVNVLEVNPRPPASLALYASAAFAVAGASDLGLVGAHRRACGAAGLPRLRAAAPQPLAGLEIVYARRPLALDLAQLRWLAGRPRTHDLPSSALRFEPGDPVCSVSAEGPDAGSVRRQLSEAVADTLSFLETST